MFFNNKKMNLKHQKKMGLFFLALDVKHQTSGKKDIEANVTTT